VPQAWSHWSGMRTADRSFGATNVIPTHSSVLRQLSFLVCLASHHLLNPTVYRHSAGIQTLIILSSSLQIAIHDAFHHAPQRPHLNKPLVRPASSPYYECFRSGRHLPHPARARHNLDRVVEYATKALKPTYSAMLLHGFSLSANRGDTNAGHRARGKRHGGG